MQLVCDCETDFHFTILAGNGFVYNCIGCDCLTCNQAPLLYLFSSVILFFFDSEWYESFITSFFLPILTISYLCIHFIKHF